MTVISFKSNDGVKNTTLKIYNVWRDCDVPEAVTVYFDRPLTEKELEFFREVCNQTFPLMDSTDE